jgi:hypothetical protein
MKKEILLFVSILCSFTAFFLGIGYEKKEKIKTLVQTPLYVNISSTKTTLTIAKNDPSINILLNGKSMTGSTLEITK